MSEKKDKERRRLERMEQSLLAEIRATQREFAWYDTTLFWGLIGTGITVLALVLKPTFAVQIFLLGLAWVCFCGSCWIALRGRKSRLAWELLSSLLIGGLIYILFVHANGGVELVAKLSVESDKEFFMVPQENQPIPPRVSRFARVKITNMGAKSVTNVKASVIRVNGYDWSYQLPLWSSDSSFIVPTTPLTVSATLNPGDDQHFEVLVECNGSLLCPRGNLVIPHIENGVRKLGAPTNSKPHEVTVRATGDGVSAVTKTFEISPEPNGKLLLKPKPDVKGGK